MKLSINEPCHENWEAMTPNQQGAFCQSCKKDVVDFSKMSVEKIKDFFSKPQDGRVCGRFEEKQLQELSFDDFFSRFRYWNFGKKFAVIFILAFGFWIFSNPVIAQNDRHYLKGEVAYVPPKTVQKDTAKKQSTNQPTIKKQSVIMGKVKCTKPVEEPKKVEPVKQETTKTEPTIVKEEHMVMGMIAVTKQVESVKQVVLTPKIDPEVKQVPKIVVVEEKKTVEENNTAPETKISVYPNPNNGHFTVETKKKQTLQLFDATGKVVLFQNLEAGATAINASSLMPGMYTVTLSGEGTAIFKKIIITR